jgi:DNA-binding transcriptional ArsR family regulator
MTVLKHAGLVESRKKERWIYYRFPDSYKNNPVVSYALEWIYCSLENDEKIKEDSKELSKILRQLPETLCRERAEEFEKKMKRKAKSNGR